HQAVVRVDELLDLCLGASVVSGDVDGKGLIAFLVDLAEGQSNAFDDVVEGIGFAGELDALIFIDYAGGLAAIRYILEYGGAEIDFGVPSFRYNLGSRIAYRESLVFPSVFTSEHQQIFAVTPNNRGTHRQT